MQGFVQGSERQQTTLLPECLDDWVGESNSRDNNFTQGRIQRRQKKIEESVARYMANSTPPAARLPQEKSRRKQCC